MQFWSRVFSPAQVTDRTIGIGLSIGLLLLIAIRYFGQEHFPVLVIPFYLLIFTFASWSIFARPYWGIVIIVSVLPITKLLPQTQWVSSILPVLGGMTVVAYIVRHLIIGKETPLFTWTHLAGFLFFAWVIISHPMATIVFGSRVIALHLIYLVVFMFLVTQLIKTAETRHLLVFGFVLSTIVSALFAMPQVKYGIDSATSTRAAGLTSSINYAGKLFVLSIMAINAYAFSQQSGTRRFATVPMITILFLGLAATVSRTSMLMAVVAMILMFFAPLGTGYKSKLKLVGLFFLSILVLTPREYWGIISGVWQSISSGTDSIGFRYMQWKAAAEMWTDNFWSGVGLGQFVSNVPHYSTQLYPFYGINYGPHSMLFGPLAETGIIGTLFLYLTFILCFAAAAMNLKSENTRPLGYLGLSFIIILLFSGSTGDSHMDLLMWLTFGLFGIPISFRKKSNPSLLTTGVA